MRLMEYGSFVVDAPDDNAASGTKAMEDNELCLSRHSGGPIPAIVYPAEVDPRPYTPPERYVVYNTHAIGMHGLKAALRVEEEGHARLTIDTVPPIEAKGRLVRLDPQSRINGRPNQLTFVPHQDFDKGGSILSSRLVDV